MGRRRGRDLIILGEKSGSGIENSWHLEEPSIIVTPQTHALDSTVPGLSPFIPFPPPTPPGAQENSVYKTGKSKLIFK